MFNYHPQTKLRKGIVFTPVCHSVHREEGIHPPRQTPPKADTHTPGQTPPGQTHPTWADTPTWAVHAGIHTPACAVYAGIRSTSGRYASHWNAFLLSLNLQLFSSGSMDSTPPPIFYSKKSILQKTFQDPLTRGQNSPTVRGQKPKRAKPIINSPLRSSHSINCEAMEPLDVAIFML